MSHYWKTLPVMADFYSWPNYRTLLNGTQVNADFFCKTKSFSSHQLGTMKKFDIFQLRIYCNKALYKGGWGISGGAFAERPTTYTPVSLLQIVLPIGSSYL